PDNGGSLRSEVERALARHGLRQLVVTQPGEYRLLQAFERWQAEGLATLDVRPDSRFLCGPGEFASWAEGRKNLRMEYFYRHMRRRYSVLLDGDQPCGGQWNYDADNRKPPALHSAIPSPYRCRPDAITEEVLALVQSRFSEHPGDLQPFEFATTRTQALAVLKQFIEQRLGKFGDFQDAMIEGEPWMYHSHLSFYLNCGLLLPLECVRAAERAYREGSAPLNGVEGFIRQILGWREYVYGIYWHLMPAYAEQNYLAAKRDLPGFYWHGRTELNCLRQVISETLANAYAHHIQRLMIVGNFALLIGVEPKQLNQWFLQIYADAYEWVELPNVSGMVLYADGGYLASKPYAAGGAYINKMSNYCKNCRYQVSKKTGPQACPFNYLYWHFLASNRDKLQNNPRLGLAYKSYDRMAADKRETIQNDAEAFLANLQ
ncbi:MAG: cryptochrome/photolyase family protein, partial [Cellvibrionaceae bacterium]|nr:cryptochrome/photolyase family protein [Cellvibrionaceae bacterium]